ncbi:phage head-tail adaptor protein [Sphingomonas sp. Leaf208]|jgi:head-tail adaptor|uniref:head-tail adaptor protein n=1 Tax=Sphingomonas sp. Leaf208 TaxID=1735679 RepID=UPI00070060D8|nr:head-tail adaptor protein [Sphingomonas sp. Leaf208]KQM56694.1 phage head-tail adaptor protein [Sphingomonas sp. Leaf208]
MIVDPGSLNRRLRIEKPVADTEFDGAGSGSWELVADVWASVQDVLPSRAENLADGMNVSARPARVRMHHRTGITAAMRFVEGERIMQIISGPAELGFREGLEFMVEEYSAAGNGA